MAHIETVEIPAGGSVALEHGGTHIMFMGLTTPLAEGQRVRITPIFEDAGRAEVEFLVTPLDDMGHVMGHDATD